MKNNECRFIYYNIYCNIYETKFCFQLSGQSCFLQHEQVAHPTIRAAAARLETISIIF